MPTRIAILTPSGLVGADYHADSLREAAGLEPDGVYTVARTYHRNRVVLLDAQLDRLEESARLEGIPFELNRARLRSALAQLIARADFGDCRFRLTVPRARPTEPLLAVDPLPPMPPEAKSAGVSAATRALARSNPRAKSNAWEADRQRARATLPPDCFEGLLVDASGRILEGFSSNFYAVHRATLRTADDGIVMGISRRIVLEVAMPTIPMVLQPVATDDLPMVEEAFLSSSSRGLVPIVRVEDVEIGEGAPGPITQALSDRYGRWVAAHLEPLEPVPGPAQDEG